MKQVRRGAGMGESPLTKNFKPGELFDGRAFSYSGFERCWIFETRYPQLRCLSRAESSAKIHKIHSSEIPCRQFSRWKMEGSSAAEATAQRANVTGKLFSIPRSPATRRSSPTLLMRDRSSS